MVDKLKNYLDKYKKSIKYIILGTVLTVSNIFLISSSQANCLFNISNLDFGSYHSPYQYTDVLSTGLISITCDNLSTGNALSIKLYQGQSTNYDRFLTNAKDNLHYNMYLDSSRSTIWGDGSSGTSVYNSILQTKNNINIFSVIHKNQNISPGNYQDSIVFEMNF